MLYVYSLARWGGASRHKIPLIESILHVNNFKLHLANQRIDLNYGLRFSLIPLNSITRSYYGFLLASYFCLQYLDSLLVLIELCYIPLIHCLNLSY